MRSISKIMVAGVLLLGTFGATASQAHDGCADKLTIKHVHTLSGGCKNPASSPMWQLKCGTKGALPSAVFTIYANNSGTDSGEVEACSDSGSGNTQGRLMLQGSMSKQGVRLILDSDADQAFAAGYIIVQASTAAQGIYCLQKDAAGDGYAASWSSPGPQTGPACIQNLAPAQANSLDMFKVVAAEFVKRYPQWSSQVAQITALLN